MRFECFLFFMLLAWPVSAQQSRNIRLKINPYKNCTVYLYGYQAGIEFIADSAWLDNNSGGAFKSTTKLPEGLYSIVAPNKVTLIQFLLDSVQHFCITVDTAHLADYEITGSVENDLFIRLLRKNSKHVLKLFALNRELEHTMSKNDSIKLKAQLATIEAHIASNRDHFLLEYPNSLTALLLRVAKPAALPVGMVIKTSQDSINATHYLLKHYWDGVSFNDDRLLYIPYFESRLNDYLKYFMSPDADSAINQLQSMLLYARTGKQIYPYLLLKFTNNYFNPTHVGQNKVLLYLFQNYYLRGDTSILNEQSKKTLYERLYTLMANQVGDPAPPLDLTLINTTPISLYAVQASYTFIVFWDPSCSHCRQFLPQLDSIYRAKWHQLNLKVFSVNINTSKNKEMEDFMKNRKLSEDWIFAYQSDTAAKLIAEKGQLNYHQCYDIYEIPSLYLLNEDKRIIAKGLSLQQFDTVLDRISRK